MNPFDDSHLLSVVTRELCKHDRHGNQQKTQIVIQFTIVAVSETSDADADELNAGDALAQAKDELSDVKSIPSRLEPIPGVVDTSATVINDTKSVSDIWGPLLDKLKLFTELVDKIAEVRSN
jgi:hypothetical protein